MNNKTNTAQLLPDSKNTGSKSPVKITGYVPKTQREREELLSYFSESKYLDDNWLITKGYERKNYTKSEITIRFRAELKPGIKTELKNATIDMLCQLHLESVKVAISSVQTIILRYFPLLPQLRSLTPMYIFRIGESIKASNDEDNTKIRTWGNFMRVLQVLGLTSQLDTALKVDIPRTYSKRFDYKIIPEEAAKELDIIFSKDIIPAPYRLIYWSFRLIPNRLREVLSMDKHCLKKFTEDTYIVTIPTYKQVPHIGGDKKIIAIKNDGIGEMYINLLKEQLSFLNSHEQKNNFLFNIQNFQITPGPQKAKQMFKKREEIVLLNKRKIYKIFNYVCNYFDIKDNDGQTISLGTHRFRHNSITERLGSGIFREIDLLPMTAHVSTNMIEQSYTHLTPRDIPNFRETDDYSSPVLDSDNGIVAQHLLSKPFASRIKGLGICTDARKCTKDKGECLRCKYLLPQKDYLEYYLSEKDLWEQKKSKAVSVGNKDYQELCQYWIDSYNIIINRIINEA